MNQQNDIPAAGEEPGGVPWIRPEIQQQIRWRDGDVVISVPGKSGTTWMMNIVHQLHTGGDADFADVYVEIHPEDARALGVRANRWVVVSTRRGRVVARALITPGIGRGQLFMPMHYRETNRLTFAAFDPSSRQPAYKACAARVRPLRRWEAR